MNLQSSGGKPPFLTLRFSPRYSNSLDMKDIRFAKLVLFVNGLVPLTLLLWDVYRKQVGANPLEFVTRTTGMLTLVFLLISLTVTPARRITGLNWLIKFRRMLGLFAFFLMLPLAITSTDKMVKRLGGKRWARLHRIVYLSGAFGVLHYYMLVKSDVRLPLTFAFILFVLLGFRLFAKYYASHARVSGSVVPPR